MTKPKFDLTNPAVAAVAKVYREQAVLAYKLAAAKDDAVRPVYGLNECTQSVEHTGSCVLLKVQDQFFALSASHVFDAVKGYQLLFGFGERLHSFAGDRFSSARGPSGSHQDDPIDASVFHITSGIAKEILPGFLTLQDLDIVTADRSPEFYVATGYRVSKSRSTSKGHSTKLDRYPSIELDNDRYETLPFSREWHLLLAFEDQVALEDKWQTAPSIRGFSGGAMFRIPRLSPLVSAKKGEHHQVKLSAILIEHRKGKHGRLSAAVGTRLGIHFALIKKYLPELQLDKLLVAEHARQTDALT